MKSLRQVVSLTAMNLRALTSRLNSSVVAIIGIAGVVLILITQLAATEGFRRVLESAGSPDIVIVMRDNSASEPTSTLSTEQVFALSESKAVAHDASGAVLSPEMFVSVDAPLASNGQIVSAALRGIGPRGALLRPGFRVTRGRMFVAGRQEIIVGAEAARQYSGLAVGSRIQLGAGTWLVAGHFADRGSVAQSEMWTDVAVLQGMYHTAGSVHSVRAKLAPGATGRQLEDEINQGAQVGAQAVEERTYFANQSRPVERIINQAGGTVTTLMALGAIFGAVNAMYAAVASRSREIATLRAIGFGARPVVASVLFEALALGLVGGLIGGVLAFAGVDGLRFSTMSALTNTQVGFAFVVTPRMVAQGVTYALVLGIIGGLLPCIRAARLPVAQSLRL